MDQDEKFEVRIMHFMWVRENQIDSRLKEGWEVAQDDYCHHNHHNVVLMKAPSGWSPVSELD